MPIAVSEYERLAGEMLRLYEEAELDMMHRVSARLARGVDTEGWTEKKYSEVGKVRKELSARVDELRSGRVTLSEDIVNRAYNDSSAAFVTEAQRFTDWAGITHISPNAQKAATILSELSSTLDAADRVILRKVDDEYAKIVGNVSARVATGTMTVRQAVQQEVKAFADKGITSFVDKAGRAWEMTTYAEMATLTAIERATIEGYCDTMQSYGFDLAVISSHAGACPLCVAWEDVVVSVSGENRDYPSLDEAISDGCFHPRCLHHLSTYYEGISKGTRTAPRKVEPPSAAYTTRSMQRALERNVRKWKREMATATDPKAERIAYAHVRDCQSKIRQLIGDYNATTPRGQDWLPRKYYREGGQQVLSPAAKKLKPVSIASK